MSMVPPTGDYRIDYRVDRLAKEVSCAMAEGVLCSDAVRKLTGRSDCECYAPAKDVQTQPP
jgi:hypothetical protein